MLEIGEHVSASYWSGHLGATGQNCATGGEEEDEQGVTGGIHHDWLSIDRIIAKDKAGRYLVKWRGLGYSEATWESSLWASDKVHSLRNSHSL